jgi:hypothetical protein
MVENLLAREIEGRYRRLRERIEAAAKRVGRDPATIRLVAVSKNQPIEKIVAAFRAGIREFGENRAQEFLSKEDSLNLEIIWHFVGHLQTNKVKQVVGKAALIHSLDSLRLAEEIEKRAASRGLKQQVLLQVNVSGEESKFGFEEEELEEVLKTVASMDHLLPRGFMAIGPLTEDQEEIRRAFRRLREIRDESRRSFPEMDLNLLSMGMTSDFEIAVEEGSDILRIGTAIFGPRVG